MGDALATIGMNVAALRRDKGLSQEDLADAAGLRQAYLSGLEAGKRNPTVRTLVRLADALSVSIDDLIRRRDGNA